MTFKTAKRSLSCFLIILISQSFVYAQQNDSLHLGELYRMSLKEYVNEILHQPKKRLQKMQSFFERETELESATLSLEG